MAYKNLVNLIISDSYDAFRHFRDYICKLNGVADYSVSGIGWTLEDENYAVDEDNISNSDWIVISSIGESGDERLVYKILVISATYWQVNGYLSWNSVTNTGTCEYKGTYSTGNMNIMAAMWIYGDLDFISFIYDIAAGAGNCNGMAFGMLESPLDDGVNNIPSAKSAGSDIEIVLVDSDKAIYDVGRYIFIYDDDDIERCLIKTNNTGTDTITVDLVNSYAIGASARSYVPYMLDGSYTTFWATNVVNAVMGLNGVKDFVCTWAVQTVAPADTVLSPGVQSQFILNRYIYMSGIADTGDYIIMPWLYGRIYTSLNYFDLLEDADGVQWRYFKLGNFYFFFKEV